MKLPMNSIPQSAFFHGVLKETNNMFVDIIIKVNFT